VISVAASPDGTAVPATSVAFQTGPTNALLLSGLVSLDPDVEPQAAASATSATRQAAASGVAIVRR
jgi:hypothetical protein